MWVRVPLWPTSTTRMKELGALDIDYLRSVLVGKRIIGTGVSKHGDGGYGASDGSTLLLDDGTVLDVWESGQECCASAFGEWVTFPDSLDAAITHVVYVRSNDDSDRDGDDYDGSLNRATITVMHNQNPLAQAECSANDGNGGYYYSVLTLTVKVPGADGREFTLVDA